MTQFKIQLPEFNAMCSDKLESNLVNAKQIFNYDFEADSPVSAPEQNQNYMWESIPSFNGTDDKQEKLDLKYQFPPQKKVRLLSNTNSIDTSFSFCNRCTFFSDCEIEEEPSPVVFEKAKDRLPTRESAPEDGDSCERRTLCDSNDDISFSSDVSRVSKAPFRSSGNSNLFDSSFGRNQNSKGPRNTSLLTVVEEDSTFQPANDLQILDEISPRRPSEQNQASLQILGLDQEFSQQSCSSGRKKKLALLNRQQIEEQNSAQNNDEDPFSKQQLAATNFTQKQQQIVRESIIPDDLEEGSTLQSTRALQDTFFARKDSQ